MSVLFLTMLTALPLTALLAGCGDTGTETPTPTPEPTPTPAPLPDAIPLGAPSAEATFYKLFTGYDNQSTFEASGVYALDDYFYVAFDNSEKLGAVHASLPSNSSLNTLSDGKNSSSGFEAITYDGYSTAHFFTVTEGESHDGDISARLHTYDDSLDEQDPVWLPFTFDVANKGFEGLAWVRRTENDYLLALCEGNRCASVEEADRGQGRIQVFVQDGNDWVWEAEITLPETANFLDYSDLALSGNQLAVISQTSRALWVGPLSETSWLIEGEGQVYTFPTGSDAGVVGEGDAPLYCRVEGVSWVDATRLVMVSDRVDETDPASCQYKGESIHLFALP